MTSQQAEQTCFFFLNALLKIGYDEIAIGLGYYAKADAEKLLKELKTSIFTNKFRVIPVLKKKDSLNHSYPCYNGYKKGIIIRYILVYIGIMLQKIK